MISATSRKERRKEGRQKGREGGISISAMVQTGNRNHSEYFGFLGDNKAKWLLGGGEATQRLAAAAGSPWSGGPKGGAGVNRIWKPDFPVGDEITVGLSGGGRSQRGCAVDAIREESMDSGKDRRNTLASLFLPPSSCH